MQILHLKPGQTYYYQIPGGNGTEISEVLSFKTAPAAGTAGEFSVGVVCDMGYTNARDTHLRLLDGVADGLSFVWHGGDISYADQWFAGIIPCVLEGAKKWDLCYNGSQTTLPGGKIDSDEYYIPVPEGEIPSQGGPNGGDISSIYETNWDLWGQFMNPITKHVPYMVAPGNHEATCAEFDGPNNEISAILDDNLPPGSHKNKSTLNYYSCPPSQRNYTAYQHRFHMPGNADLNRPGGQNNFWYSHDYGLAHFVTISTETDYYKSPSWPFIADMKGKEGHPTKNQTFLTDAGPFGNINGSYTVNANYEQIQWLRSDLAKVDRKKTPWIFVLSHRPMYSSEFSKYQLNVRDAFEEIFLEYGVDVYIAGHIHWYERLFPLGRNGTVNTNAVAGNHTYKATKDSLIHLVNGQAGMVESHSTLKGNWAKYTAVLDQENWGLGRINVKNQTHTLWEFVKAKDGQLGDYLWIVKE